MRCFTIYYNHSILNCKRGGIVAYLPVAERFAIKQRHPFISVVSYNKCGSKNQSDGNSKKENIFFYEIYFIGKINCMYESTPFY